MMALEDRGDAYERKFAHDAELKFKAEARRNKLLGLWAAGLMGKSDEEAADYAKEVVRADFEEAGDEDVFRKLRADLSSDTSDEDIRTQMVAKMGQAMQQIEDESSQ
ncbi:MAG: DUF1476 domain-containing protein [Pseudomonadota bacterium]